VFQEILIPVDFSEKNRAAVDIAAELAAKSEGQATLLHVIETVEHIPFEEMRDFYSRLERSARRGVEDLAEKFVSDGVRYRSAIVLGKRLEEIIRHAIDNQADLIVMSSHRVDPDRPAAGFGTLSYRVAILAPCPVLLVK